MTLPLAAKPAEDEGLVDFFSDRRNDYGIESRWMAKYIGNYPNTIGRWVERLYDWRLQWLLRGATANVVSTPPRKVLVLGVRVEKRADWLDRVMLKLRSNHHLVSCRTKNMDATPRVTNLNLLLHEAPIDDFDWVITADDDIDLPEDFLDVFLHFCEQCDMSIAQPAHRFQSHASYALNMRHWNCVARETGFVEVGPLVAFHRRTFSSLLPFPDVGMGHGLDINWSWLARQHGWKLGVVDATPLRHLNPVGAAYNQREMQVLASRFLKQAGHVSKREALVTIQRFP